MQRLVPGQVLTRRDIATLFGGNARAFLPRVTGGDVVAGCFDPDVNPRVPHEVLVHSAPNAILAAKRLVKQCRVSSPTVVEGVTRPLTIPVFIKRAPNVWEYIGQFRAIRYSADKREVTLRVYEIRPRIYEKHVREYGEMKGILFLEME